MRDSIVMPAALAAALVAAGATPVRAQTTTDSDVARRLRAAVDSLAAAGEFAGVVVLARGGTPVLQLAHGMADRSAQRPSDVETAFNLGSISKMFTAVAIAQLAEAGRVQLDSPIATYWPDYPNAEVARRVTLRQLLAHRSGIGGNIFAPPPGGSRADLRHNRDFVPRTPRSATPAGGETRPPMHLLPPIPAHRRAGAAPPVAGIRPPAT